MVIVNFEETYHCFINAYFGIRELDQYLYKEYVLQKIEDYMKSYVQQNPKFVYQEEEVFQVIQTSSMKRKLQDALLILPRIQVDMDLILFVKHEIQNMEE